MSNRSATYTLSLNSNVKQVLVETEAVALRLDGVMSSMNRTMHMLGLGFAGAALIHGAKDWVEGAANYEDAINRIRFASDNLSEGANNIKFIRGEVEKFKIPLQSATDDYGKFLAMVQGSGMAIETVQSLHDQILMIAKIKHLDAGQLSAGVMNLGKMLEAGAMDARHLRPLEMQLSGIGKFIADEMGVTIHELAQLRNKGKLTDVDPKVLLAAIEKQAASLEQHLPEALMSTQSIINDMSNDWLNFKNNIVFDLKPTLIEFFNTLKDGIGWLNDNRDLVISFGTAILHIGEAYLAYKVGLFAVNGMQALFGLNAAKQLAQTTQITSATAQETLAIERLIVVLEGLAAVQTEVALTSEAMINAQVSSMGVNYMAMQNFAMRGNAAVSGMMGSVTTGGMVGAGMSTIGRAVVPVMIVAMGAQVVNDLWGPKGLKEFGSEKPGVLETARDNLFNQSGVFGEPFYYRFDRQQEAHDVLQNNIGGLGGKNLKGDEWWDPIKQANAPEKTLDPKGNDLFKALESSQASVDGLAKKWDGVRTNLMDAINPLTATGERMYKTNEELYDVLKGFGYQLPYLTKPPTDPNGAGGHGDFKSQITDTNKIKGNSVTNVNVNIGEMIGMKGNTFEVKNMADMDKIKNVIYEEIVRNLTQAVNDSQIVAGK